MGVHSPPVRASGYSYVGVLPLRNPANNTASQQVADLFSNSIFSVVILLAGDNNANWTTINEINYSLHNLNGMHFFFYHTPVNVPEQVTLKQAVTRDEDLLHNIKESSEFMDDALRMKDQPLMSAEETQAPGSLR
jgi:hypothetical protein